MTLPRPCFTALNTEQSQYKVNTLQLLQKQVEMCQELTKIIQPHLPPSGEWTVVHYQQGILTLAGQNHALIAQIRYLHSQFVQQLKTIYPLRDLVKINVVQQYTISPQIKKYTKTQHLSNQTCQYLKNAADMVSDGELKKALLSIAEHHLTPK